MELLGEHNNSFLAIFLWGCFGGICLAIVYFLLQGIWIQFLPCGTVYFSLFYHAQTAVVFALILIILGYFAGILFCTGKDTREIRTGIVSGTCTALVFTAISTFLMFARGSVDFSLLPLRLVQILVASMILQVIGTYFHKPRCESVPEDAGILDTSAVAKKIRSSKSLFPVVLAVLAVLAVLIITPLYLKMSTGGVTEELMCYVPINDRVDVTRTSPDSIHIVMLPDLWTNHHLVPTIKILLDEKDASNQSMIERSRLDVVIYPAEGLQFKRKASVTFQGKDVAGNVTVPLHLQIAVSYPDRGIQHIICDKQV
jgi:hypothetical protein